jgi:hypothetical protein
MAILCRAAKNRLRGTRGKAESEEEGEGNRADLIILPGVQCCGTGTGTVGTVTF